jgi:tRNA threonylcarbamoyladenosine biosynthesis protein TsaB
MKTILAIETSSRRSSVAVMSGEHCVFDEGYEAGRRETGPLFSTVERAMAAVPQVDLVAVGLGPGSYNGLRAAVALGEGLAVGRGIRCAGWSSLLAFPSQPPEPAELRVLAGDARGGKVFFALVADHQFLCEPRLIASGELEAAVKAESRTRDARLSWIGESPPGPLWQPEYPTARELAIVAGRALKNTNFSPPRPLPMYLKPLHITKGKPS